MPFSSKAWPRWTPSSDLCISPISNSQDTNSLKKQIKKTNFTSHTTRSTACPSPLLVFPTILVNDSLAQWSSKRRTTFKKTHSLQLLFYFGITTVSHETSFLLRCFPCMKLTWHIVKIFHVFWDILSWHSCIW